MNSLEKEFVSYDLALEMKGLGFDKPCLGFYQKEYLEECPVMVDDDNQYRLTGWRTCKNSEIPEHYTSAPLKSQVFDFFRGYRLTYVINDYMDDYEANIIEWTLSDDRIVHEFPDRFDSWEEAESACINKLIEIVKNK